MSTLPRKLTKYQLLAIIGEQSELADFSLTSRYGGHVIELTAEQYNWRTNEVEITAIWGVES